MNSQDASKLKNGIYPFRNKGFAIVINKTIKEIFVGVNASENATKRFKIICPINTSVKKTGQAE